MTKLPPLAKPRRIAFLAPELVVEGPDVAVEREASLLVWIACIELCLRHPGLAVYDLESMPIVSQAGHFVPKHASRGSTPNDAVFGPARRDELLWLELTLVAGKSGAVRLHAIGRDGSRQSFDAIGRKLGDQIDQVFAAWLGARGLGPLPRRFEPVTADEVLAIVRMIAPTLGERARQQQQPRATTAAWDAEEREPTVATLIPRPEPRAETESDGDGGDTDPGASMTIQMLSALVDATAEHVPVAPPTQAKASRVARTLVGRLPSALRVPTLRLLSIVLHEDLDDLILAIDPEHPQALFARFVAAELEDFPLLRRVIAAAPGWARPYAELVRDRFGVLVDDAPDTAPTLLETAAGAGMAALCRPGNLDVLDAASQKLADAGRVDEGVRLALRALALHDEPRAHVALMSMLREDE
ncbi:MAG: hypothetical protein NT062_09965, partial [Proteobacteria bacterium]|nr:hypothetical protein [Pseudomonadota bacterium]